LLRRMLGEEVASKEKRGAKEGRDQSVM